MYWLGKPTPTLSIKEEIELITEFKKTKSLKIARKVIKANFGLAIEAIKKYNRIYSFDDADMFQEGVLGLYKALEKFDLSLEIRFATYATNWVHTYILSFIKKNARIVTVTEYANSQLLKFKKAIDHVELKDKWGNYKYNQIKVLSDVAVYDKPIKKDIKSFADSSKELHKKNIQTNVNEILKTFSPKEKLTIRCRYSLNKGTKKTLEEIGYPFNITKERIRQIEKKALKKLRASLKKKGIKIGDMYGD
jgi:RNA polymerase primary sigma factor